MGRFIHLPHRDAMIRHAIKRLWERRGIALSLPEYEAMCAPLRAGTRLPAAVSHSGNKVFPISHRGAVAYGVWNDEHGCIVTFYPTLRWILRDGGHLVGAEAVG